MTRSPRNALLFGLAWTTLWWSLLPGLYLVSRRFCRIPSPYGVSAPGAAPAALLLGAALMIGYGLLVLTLACAGLVRRNWPACGGLWRILAGAAGAGFWGCAPVLLAVSLRQRRYGDVLIASAATFCAAAVAAAWLSPSNAGPPVLTVWLLACGGTLLMIVAAAGIHDRVPLRRRSLWPLAVAGAFLAALYLYQAQLEAGIDRERRTLAQLLGHSIELEDFRARQRQGFPVDAEPLRALIVNRPGASARFPERMEPGREEDKAVHLDIASCPEPAELRDRLTLYRNAYPEFVAAVDAFLTLPVQPVRHPQSDGMLIAMTLPELAAFRSAAQYLAWELACRAGDRETVLRRDADIGRLRDWCLADFSRLAKNAGLAIENLRLSALAYPLAAGTLSAEEWRRLLQDHPDWNAVFARALGDEAMTFESIVNQLLRRQKNGDTEWPFPWPVISRKRPAIEAELFLRYDYRFALSAYRRLAELFRQPVPPSGRERSDAARAAIEPAGREGGILSAMLLPTLDKPYRDIAAIEDRYRMAETARRIEEYRAVHGKLPETLDFLETIPVDSLNGRPMGYEWDRLEVLDRAGTVRIRCGYRLYACDEAGRGPGGLRALNRFTVPLEPAALRP